MLSCGSTHVLFHGAFGLELLSQVCPSSKGLVVQRIEVETRRVAEVHDTGGGPHRVYGRGHLPPDHLPRQAAAWHREGQDRGDSVEKGHGAA